MSAKYSAKENSPEWSLRHRRGARTDNRPMQYKMAQTIGKAVGINEATADVAIAYAVEKGWLIAEGNPPHSVSLIYGWGEE
jgi:hypothetical protein